MKARHAERIDRPLRPVADRAHPYRKRPYSALNWRNLATLAEAVDWRAVTKGPIEPIVEDPTFLAQAVVSLPREPCDGATWREWTDTLKAASGREGRALYHPR